MPDQKSCRGCKKSKSVEEFSERVVRGKRYKRVYCKTCSNKRRYERRQRAGTTCNATHDRYGKKRKRWRQRNERTECFIFWETRAADRKRGQENDLTKEFIKGLIDRGCEYCGETQLRMTLDRVDNDKGHTQDNVVPACIRCNYARRSMPHEAWLLLVPGMKEARERGLFGDWTGRAR